MEDLTREQIAEQHQKRAESRSKINKLGLAIFEAIEKVEKEIESEGGTLYEIEVQAALIKELNAITQRNINNLINQI